MKIEELLKKGLEELGVGYDNKVIDRFIIYKNLLVKWNSVMNLTSIEEEQDIITKHFIDSLTIIKFINISNARIIDVGTGAGFPGLPLKIVDETISMTLLDSLNKRINFLDEAVMQLGLKSVELIHGRSEDFGIKKEYRENFDYCVSRAVANLSTLSEYCLSFVKVGGYFVSLKGPDIEEEINEAKNAIKVLGGECERIEKITLPSSDITHSLVFIKKIGQCPTIYPRKAGKPSKEPIK